ncbi:hypothetical protein [Marinobacter sp. bablab_jr015]|uniref:hypothetical protein n=1 Tax=Marinobacter sp. bablab_jr015 TaxID=2755060 RepID=UPI0018F13C6C|nr:hypothetical protein [Marinobacter sp. bablab_jr015]
MAKRTPTCSDELYRLIALARLAQCGDHRATERLAAKISKTVGQTKLLAEIASFLRKENRKRQDNQRRREQAKDRLRPPTFAPTHPCFRKKTKKRRPSSDAMFRAILCGGFETNRSRH